MGRNMSIRLRISLWFSLALIVLVGLTYLIISLVAKNILIKNLQDNLAETALHNIRGLEYISPDTYMDPNKSYLFYNRGYIEVDEDFLDIANGVYSSLYTDDHEMIYGEDPIAKQSFVIDFSKDQVKIMNVDGIKYYIYDIDLGDGDYQGLWLRAIVAETHGLAYIEDIGKVAYIALPLICLLAIGGGYLIVKRSLDPISKVTGAARAIQESGNLQKRVDIGPGRDEAHHLAQTFNDMLDRIEDAFERQKQFTSDVSHELRTPTSVIMAQAEFYLEKERTKEDYIKALTVIHKQGTRMRDLINSMLDISRLEMNPQNYLKEEVDLSDLVQATCWEMDLIRDKDICLDCQLEDGIFVRANEGLVKRMLVNLISNAFSYGKDQGHIWLRLETHRDKARLVVEDDGIGIREEDLDKIFRSFYQSDGSRHDKGTGLGLAMVKDIVDFHDGDIRVESVYGQGTVFTVELKAI